MAEATQYLLTHQELVTLLIKHKGIHEGIWQLLINFGFGAANIGPNAAALNPTAMIPITGIGIHRATELNALTVNAAVVNPAT
jgi:hypothetical protein